MAFIERLDDKVTKWQSQNRTKLFIYSNFVNFATLSQQFFCRILFDLMDKTRRWGVGRWLEG